MIIKPKIDNENIIALAQQKLLIDRKITKIIQEENPTFSYKKLIADLGEYYAKKNIEEFFDKLEFSKNRVSECDLIGTLKDEYAKEWELPRSVGIEIKTRYWQKGAPHLGNVNIDNFDLLVFVSLNEDYSIHYISMCKNSDLTVTNNQKVIYRANIKTVFATDERFVPHK